MRAFAMSVRMGPFSRASSAWRKNGVENADCGWRFARLCMRYIESLPEGSVNREITDGWSGLKYA